MTEASATATTRKEIEAAALEAGASYWAVRKWYERGAVPMKWRVQIVEASGGAIALSDFHVFERGRREVTP